MTLVLPYLAKPLLQICTRINCVIKNKLPNFNFQIVFQTKYKLINVFRFKEKLPVFLCPGIVDKPNWGNGSATYVKVRMCERLGVSAKKRDDDSTLKTSFVCNHSSGFDNFSISVNQQQWLQNYLVGESFHQ